MYARILANLAMHITLEAAEAELFTAALEYKMVKKNTVLLKEGALCRNIFFVNSGCLRVYNTDSGGLEHNVLFCPENWWATDMASFSQQTPSFYTIDALEDTEVFYLSYVALEQLYVSLPKLERFFRILTQNGFYLYQRRMSDSLSKPAEERYALFQQQYPGLEQRIAQKHIASFLGITPVFLSIIRKRR